jgi:hypothetical protein
MWRTPATAGGVIDEDLEESRRRIYLRHPGSTIEEAPRPEEEWLFW